MVSHSSVVPVIPYPRRQPEIMPTDIDMADELQPEVMQTDADVADPNIDYPEVRILLNNPPSQHARFVRNLRAAFNAALAEPEDATKQEQLLFVIDDNVKDRRSLPNVLKRYFFINNDVKRPLPSKSAEELLRLSSKGLPYFLCNACNRGMSFFSLHVLRSEILSLTRLVIDHHHYV